MGGGGGVLVVLLATRFALANADEVCPDFPPLETPQPHCNSVRDALLLSPSLVY